MEKIVLRSIFLFLVIGTIACQSESAIAQTNVKFSDLKLEISTRKDNFVQLEPIVIKFKVSNPTTQSILGHTSFNLTSNFTNLVVRNEKGEEKMFSGFSPLPKQVGVYPRPIKPGESQEVENLLNYRLQEMFPSAGKYEVRSIFFNFSKPGKAISNTVTLTIKAPEQPDKEAFDFINKTANSAMFFTGDVSLEKREKIWRKFLLQHANTVYADFITFALGQHLFFANQFQESQTLLEGLSSKPDFIFADRVENYLSEINRKP